MYCSGMIANRRNFLSHTGRAASAALALPLGARENPSAASRKTAPSYADWNAVRGEFLLRRDRIHMALMLLASHPRPVRDAIETHRRGLDENPVDYFEERFFHIEADLRAKVAAYTGGGPDGIALTDSTTMGLGVLYSGLPLRSNQEILTTKHDHYATHESLRLRALRTGAPAPRQVALYDTPAKVSQDEATSRLLAAIGPRTRIVAVTWVHSSTGVKLPIRRFATEIETLNRNRDEADRVLLCVDGVHGFGVEQESPADLGCDFFVAGCHKWMFGPRGTGIVWGKPAAWKGHAGPIAAFDMDPYGAWMKGTVPAGPPGPLATPGGFHSFEHRWALGEAFAFHQKIGRVRITNRIHELAAQCKEGLAKMPHVAVHTPRDEKLSAGLVCFEVKGLPAKDVIKRLHHRNIIGSVTPYAAEYARLSPGILNTPDEITTVLREIRALA